MNTHVHPALAEALKAMAPRVEQSPLHADRIVWWPAKGVRIVPPGHMLVKSRDGIYIAELDSWGTWRQPDGRIVREVSAYADLPEGPL